MSQPAIQCENYSFRFDQRRMVLNSISFKIYPNEHTAVLGLNGAGKSTLLRSLVGLHKGEGTIRIRGMEVKRSNLSHIRQKVGFIFQDPQIQLFCPSVIEDVAFGPLNLYGKPERAREEARLALSEVGFRGEEFTPCHMLSLGEMRKVSLAGVLACKPDILLMDEPDCYLDAEGKQRLVEILQRLNNVTRVLATHDLDFARNLCNRCIYLENGLITYDGQMETFILPIYR